MIRFLITLTFFIFTTYIQAQAIIASIELLNTPIENNITHYTVTDPNNEPYTIQTAIGGEQCRHIPATKYGYFRINDATITSNDNNLIFTITFFDSGSGNLFFQYNATNNNNYKGVYITRTNTNKWITATLALTDASFRNAQNNASDFRIAGESYIKTITIAKGTLNPANEPTVNVNASNYSEFTGKSVAGYQVWFSTGTTSSGWFHWNGGVQPSANKLNFEVYPDVSEYNDNDLTTTGFANLGNGDLSKLFNSANTGVINTHFKWMKDAGIDGVALQRFINGIGTVIINSDESHLLKVKDAAENNNKIFYICYDITSSGLDDTWDDIIKFDWVYNIEKTFQLTNSPAYAKVGNKPVVQIWGTGFTGNHPGTAQETIDLIDFLKARGCYVIGGLPTYWRTGTNDSKTDFLEAYKKYDMISPWSVGRYSDINGANNFKTNLLIPDKTFCDQHNIAYMPVLFPGFSWSLWNNGKPNMISRQSGKFFWQQALNIQSIGVSSMYFAMFDKYDEGTAIMKAATDWSMIPTDQYFVTLSADGIWMSSDFYLRLAGAATSMLKGNTQLSTAIPIPFSNGPVYYRNSFESIFATCKETQYSGYYPVDPCFYNPVILANSGVNNASASIENNSSYAHSGQFACKINGTAASSTAAIFYYKIAETSIKVKENMALSFWKYTSNDLGRYTSIDLQFKSGKVLRDLPAYKDQTGNGMHPGNGRGSVGSWQKFTCQIGVGELINDEITGIIVAYDQPVANGSFTAYFDDIMIEDDDIITSVQEQIKTTLQLKSQKGNIIINGIHQDTQIEIYSITGQKIKQITTSDTQVSIPLTQGLYIVSIKNNKMQTSRKVFVE